MNAKQYNTTIAAIGWNPESRTAQACKLVLVDGLTAYAAAHSVGLDKAAISRGLDRIAHFKQCPTCGQEIKNPTD